MKIALIGLPQSGKSTLAGAITGHVPEHTAPGQIHRCVVKVPDDRLDVLARMYDPKKLTHAAVEFIDVPGFSLADRAGQEDLQRLLPEIRQCDLLAAVVRDFENPSVPAYRDRINADSDLAELQDELRCADLIAVSTRAEKLEHALKKPSKTHDREKRELAVLITCRDALENSVSLSEVLESVEDRRMLSSFALLTVKPVLVVFNVSEDRAAEPDPPPPPGTVGAVRLSASTELDIAQLEPADRRAFLDDLGVSSPACDRLVRAGYSGLGLISFLTVGPDEVRAWTITSGADAVEAARKIHSDIARGFIRAETVAYDDLIEAGDMKTAKSNAKVRQEGKTYRVRDGDVINFKFNV